MYNIEVDSAHCYRVTESGVLVHNADYTPPWLARGAKGFFQIFDARAHHLADRAFKLRARKTLPGKATVAVVEYSDGSILEFIGEEFLNATRHAEQKVINAARGRTVKRMYIDRTGCPFCNPKIMENRVFQKMEEYTFWSPFESGSLPIAESLTKHAMDFYGAFFP